MANWVIMSSGGILTQYGPYETEEECEQKCKELREQAYFVNIYFMPVQKGEGDDNGDF